MVWYGQRRIYMVGGLGPRRGGRLHLRIGYIIFRWGMADEVTSISMDRNIYDAIM